MPLEARRIGWDTEPLTEKELVRCEAAVVCYHAQPLAGRTDGTTVGQLVDLIDICTARSFMDRN